MDRVTISEKFANIEDLKTFLEGLFVHAPVGFAVTTPDGYNLAVNQTFVELFGSAPPPEYCVFEDTLAEQIGFAGLIRRAFRGETITTPIAWYDTRELENIQIETGRRVAISMTIFPLFDKQGEIQYVIATYRDHTEEELARERIEAERDKFRALFESILDGIVLLDQQGRFAEANPAAGRILGCDPHLLAGKSYADFAGASQGIGAAWERFLAQGGQRGEAEILAAGHTRTIEYQFVSEFAPGLYLGLLRDITEKIQLRRDRLVLEEQLRQAQKIEAIGRLAGSVAHDFNNLLTVINGYAELLLADLPAEASEAMQQIYMAGQQAAALTNQLLAFGRKSILKPALIDLNSVILKLEKMFRRLLSEEIEINLQLDPALEQVLIDPSQFEQVVMNLVLNARDAMPAGGLLLVQTSNLQLSEHYDLTHAEVEAGRYVMLAVSDNGIGMDKATRERIFEPFYTTKAEGQGTGLGLSTVHGIVRQSGGHIFVYSEPGHGSTFKIYFPCLDQAASRAQPEAAPAVLPEGNESVLLVEDVQEVRDFIRLVLESCGYSVHVAGSGPEALELFPSLREQCSLLISDVIMPKMSGPRLAENLRESAPELEVLYISGYTDDAVLRYGILTDGIPFLAKPFTPSQLASKVREVLDRAAG